MNHLVARLTVPVMAVLCAGVAHAGVEVDRFPEGGSTNLAAQESDGDSDPLAVIFVGDPLDDDTHRAFAREARAIARDAGATLFMTERRGAAALLGHVDPSFALVIAPPDELDAGLHRSLLLASTAFDSDPFVDVALGYLTGSTPAALRATWERSERVRREGLRSKRWIETFVTSGMKSTVYSGRIPELARVAGYDGHGLAFSVIESDPEVGDFVLERLPDVDDCAVLSITGNGDPQGVWLFSGQRNLDRSLHWPYDPQQVGRDPDGVMPRVLADAWRARDLKGSVVWSGTCHSAVCGPAWVEGDIVSTFGRVQSPTLHALPAEQSMGLALLDAGAAALLAPIGANHGMAVDREQRFAFQTGAPLGDVIKSTYDDIVLAAGGMPALGVPDRTEEGMAAWEREPVMAGGGANRILIGDPRLAPFPAVTSGHETIESSWSRTDRGDLLSVDVRWADGFHSAAWDMYGTDREADWRVVARVEVDPARVPIDASIEVVEFSSRHPETEADQPYGSPRAMVEHHRSRAFIHLTANAPPGDHVLQGGSGTFRCPSGALSGVEGLRRLRKNSDFVENSGTGAPVLRGSGP